MLTPDQLTAIDRHLRKENWLLNEELIRELTDHYVAGTEERMQRGMPFEAAIREIHAEFGGRKGLLELEETYQINKAASIDRLQWELVSSFTSGTRWYVGVLMFCIFFFVNTQTTLRDFFQSANYIGYFYVTCALGGNLLRGILVFYKNRHEVNQAAFFNTSAVYVVAYFLSLSLLLLNKYVFPTYQVGLQYSVVIALNTLIETLCLVFYLATFIALWRSVRTNRRKSLLKTT